MPASLNPMVTYGVLCNESTYRSICGKYSPCYVTVGVQKGTIPYQTDIELSKVNTSLYFENNRVERRTTKQSHIKSYNDICINCDWIIIFTTYSFRNRFVN